MDTSLNMGIITIEYQEVLGYTLDTIVEAYLPLIGATSETTYGHSGHRLKDIVVGMVKKQYLANEQPRQLGQICERREQVNRQVFFEYDEAKLIAEFLCTFPREDKKLLSKYINYQNKFREANGLPLIEPISREMILENLKEIGPQEFQVKNIIDEA